MRPLKLTLEGFYGVRDGMKRDSVTLDLESLPGGLIALTGPNGAGKSTIMDNLHPYRIMPSRAAKLSVDAFSYWDHVCGAQALKEFEWEHGGVRYRSSFAFRKPGKTGKADYFLLYRTADGTWQPVVLPDGTVADGKAETYDRCVEAICGTLETFFTSVFSAQNRRPLASYGASEIKGLLAELLKIDHLRALSTKAGDVAKVLGRALDGVQQQLAAFSGKRERLVQTVREIAPDDEALAATRKDRDTRQSDVANLMQQRAALVAKQAENASTAARVRDLTVRRTELNAALQANANDVKALDQRIAQRRRALNEAVSKHETTLGQRDAINGAAAARDDAQMRIGSAEAKVEPLQALIADLEQKRLTLTSLTSGLKGLESDGTSKLTLLRTLEAQAAVVDSVPCAGHEMHNTCPLLAQGREAGAKAVEHRVSLQSLRESFRTQRAQADQLEPQVQQLAAKRVELKAVNDALARARQDLQKAVDLAARKPLLDAAAEGLAAARNDLQTLDAEERDARQRREAETTRLTLQRQEVDAELARLAAVDVTAAIADVDRRLAATREAVTAADARIEALIRAQATRQAECDALEKELGGFDATHSRANRISDEIARWKLLAKGLGNEGVIALTIDDAGPALTQTVNDLLLACYGTRFTVEIRTQRELASGEMREGFEILVHDADNDSTKAISVMSGGQKVWINECVTRGIALYLAGNAGQPYQTLFSDESDGPLDPERKLQFMRMKREVLKQGGYEREFFISQTPDLVAEADAVIDVEALAV
ncbi:SMC family ATPase [Paraburkholderia sp. SARCC-3016]|uniref:AAA family ATPase n=1 Tax=Paraburkholderia sp. SARCC-3016 TaxID=3058611 RepID=UPI002807C1AD|nr:SMC family ATPase [Paraburkholderia sp. SARCC-3016]MDQ7980295.1 SMC family ATPase [Paraburkholderia sp. SARCC-3016]